MSTTEPRSVLLSATEAATRLGVSRPTIYRMARRGEIPAVRLGDRTGATLRFDRRAIEAWIAQRTTGGDAAA